MNIILSETEKNCFDYFKKYCTENRIKGMAIKDYLHRIDFGDSNILNSLIKKNYLQIVNSYVLLK